MNVPCRRIAAFTVVVAVLTSGGPVAIAQSPDASLPRSNVAELVTFLPPSSTMAGFTDWGRIKASQGASDVTGASPIDDKLQVGLSTTRDEAMASGFGLAHVRDHYDVWGWDNMDLDWEAVITDDGPPIFVLRFRDGFDLTPIAARFDERDFTTTAVPGATIRSHEMSLRDDWLRATEFAILNTAFLDDGRTLVLSSDADQVREVVASYRDPLPMPGLDATAATLEGASAAMLLYGLGTCVGFTPLPVDLADPLASPDLSMPTADLHPYASLGIGYGRPDWDPVGRISFGYPDAASAQDDLAGRLHLATTGDSQRVGQPIADVLFQVAESHVDGANLTFDAAPANDRPRLLFDMVYMRDMVFAGC